MKIILYLIKKIIIKKITINMKLKNINNILNHNELIRKFKEVSLLNSSKKNLYFLLVFFYLLRNNTY